MPKAVFTDPEELKQKIDEYFDNAEAPTLSGLAYSLGVTRRTLCNYIRDGDTDGKSNKAKCCAMLVMAKARIEMWLEEQLVMRAKTGGIQFALENNYEWGKKMSVNVESNMSRSSAGTVEPGKLTDEELMARIEILTEKVCEIRRREGDDTC